MYLTEIFFLKKNNSIFLHDYGNYQLLKSKVPKKPIVYSGGVGTNISFDLALIKKIKLKLNYLILLLIVLIL